jgi:hypothetical protein
MRAVNHIPVHTEKTARGPGVAVINARLRGRSVSSLDGKMS